MHAKRRDEILSDAHGNILLDVVLLRSAREEERANKSCGLKPRESRLAEYESKKIKKSTRIISSMLPSKEGIIRFMITLLASNRYHNDSICYLLIDRVPLVDGRLLSKVD